MINTFTLVVTGNKTTMIVVSYVQDCRIRGDRKRQKDECLVNVADTNPICTGTRSVSENCRATILWYGVPLSQYGYFNSRMDSLIFMYGLLPLTQSAKFEMNKRFAQTIGGRYNVANARFVTPLSLWKNHCIETTLTHLALALFDCFPRMANTH
jgi:hypothetical protein